MFLNNPNFADRANQRPNDQNCGQGENFPAP
jgi:hypothetical protein